MGGRGASGVSLSARQERRLEDAAQLSDAKALGARARARYYEYTDSSGKVHKGETGANTPGGTYRAQYSTQVAAYAKMSTSELEKEQRRLQEASNSAYQRFTRVAASKSGSEASQFASADTQLRMIRQVLRRRKKR